MSVLLSKTFYLYSGLRAIKTLAQSLVALLAANQSGLLSTHWGGILSVAGMAALLSMLTSVASADQIVPVAPEGPPEV